MKDAGTQRVRLEVPEGAAPGGRLDAAFPDGRKLVAVVPDWARAGDFVYATAAV